MKAVTILPQSIVLALQVTTPRSTRSTSDVGEHLRVDAQMLLAVEVQADGARDGADAHLDRGLVRDEIGDVLADPALDVAELAGWWS